MSILSRVFLLPLLILCGCASVDTATCFSKEHAGRQQPIASIAAENTGYYLFGLVPILGGDPHYPNTASSVFGESATIENNFQMMNQAAQPLGGKTYAHAESEIIWTGSFSMWIVWKKTVHTRALIMR